MESAPDLTAPAAGHAVPYSIEHHDTSIRRPESIVIQVDSAVSSVDGLTWLAARRSGEVSDQLSALQREAAAQRWGWPDLTRARLKLLRPRRAEMNELGAAHLAGMLPGAVEAVNELRRAGVAVTLASDVAAEALFGVATALGVSPNELYAPRLRFDALGAYVGCDLNAARADDERMAMGGPVTSPVRMLFVGTRRSAVFAPRATDDFVAFSGVVPLVRAGDALATVASFAELTGLVLA